MVGSRYINGSPFGIAGADWTITNYTGGRVNGSNFVLVQESVPTTGLSSNWSVPVVVNGTALVFSIAEFTRTDGIQSVTYGLVTVTGLVQPSSGLTASDKSRIADSLLSIFNRVGASIFGSDGIPDTATGDNGAGPGLSLTPMGVSSAPPALRTGPGLAQRTAIEPASARSSPGGFDFAFNLQRLLAERRKRDASDVLGLADLPTAPESKWNVWARGRYTDFGDRSSGADRDGHMWRAAAGVSYALSDSTTLGAVTRVRKGEVDSSALNASLDSDFYGGGLYFSTLLGGGIRVTGAGLYEFGDSDIRIAGATGSFNTAQVTLEARVDRRFTWGRHWVEPAVSVLYADMDRDGYTDSSGTAVGSGGTTLGRLSFGPKVGTTFEHRGTTVRPYARVGGLWDFENGGDFTLSTGADVSAADVAVNLGGGVEVQLRNGAKVTLAGDWTGFDTGLDTVSVSGSVGVPLAAFGIGGAAGGGQFAFDFSGSAETGAAKARVEIPFGGAVRKQMD